MRKRRGSKTFTLGFVLLFMGIIAALGYSYEDKIKYNLSKDFNLEMQEYKYHDPEFTYNIPVDWSSEVKSIGGSNSYYYSVILSNDNKSYGYIQVKNMKKDFLRKVKNGEILDNTAIKDKVEINLEKDGEKDRVKLKYTTKDSRNEKHKVIEYYIFKEDQYLKIMLQTKENSGDAYKIIEKVVESVDFI